MRGPEALLSVYSYHMKPKSFFLSFAAVAACVGAGCTPDNSGATQQMPPVAKSANSAASLPMGNLPPAAQEKLKDAANAPKAGAGK
jgi:hypothetical protein